MSGGRSDEPLGRRVFQIHLAVNGRFIKTVEATADVAALVDVVVPVRSIKADEEIGRRCRHRAYRAVRPEATVRDQPGRRDRKAAIRPLPPQNAIRLTSVRRPSPCTKAIGSRLKPGREGLSIQTVGVTKSHGELGQTITVSNVDSERLAGDGRRPGWSVLALGYCPWDLAVPPCWCALWRSAPTPAAPVHLPRSLPRPMWLSCRLRNDGITLAGGKRPSLSL